MPKVKERVCPTCGQPRGEAHRIITKRPPRLSMFIHIEDNMVKATDGCFTTAAGMCEHGHSSWAVVMKMVKPTGEKKTIPFFKHQTR